jgi:CRISPR-associated endonuclease Cas1
LVLRQSEIQDTEKARQINRLIICKKLTASIETLRTGFEATEATAKAILRILQLYGKLANPKARWSYRTILGYEGAAAAIYYSTWHDLPLKWSNLSTRPIPNSWKQIGSRQMIWRKDANYARHPLNAMLNYGYALLISALHTEIVMAGLDPSIGIAHRRHTNPIPLVYDLMEPLRPVVDKNVLQFAMSSTFTPGDFTITQAGGCRLNPQVAKAVAGSIGNVGATGVITAVIQALA